MIQSGSQELLAALQTLQKEEVPEGWYPRQWYEKEWKKSTAQTLLYIRRAIESGLMEQKRFIVQTGQRVLPVPHYRMK